MTRCARIGLGLLLSLAVGPMALATQDPPTTPRLGFYQVVEQILATYPSLRTAALQVERARQELTRVESQLGWSLSGQGGVNHDLSSFGIPSDVADISAGLNRRLRSGHSVGLNGSYRYEDSSLSFSPLLPNPSESIRLDLDYRVPLARGKDNPDYTQGLASADAGVLLEQANRLAVREQLVRQALELFYAAVATRARLDSARAGVDRARRLKAYIQSKLELGLAEDKDVLQAEAQLQLQRSDLRALQIAWAQQRTTLNRLTGRAWQAEFIPEPDHRDGASLERQPLAAWVQAAQANSPDLLRNQARLRLSEASLEQARNRRRDQLDVVVSVGARQVRGDSSNGSVSEEDLAGGIRLEYQQALDKRGFDAEIYQSQLDRQIADEDSRQIKDDLRYEVARLLAEIRASRTALQTFRQRQRSEQAKLDEAMSRYRKGRIETDRLIQFENELQGAALALALQRIEYQRRQHDLEILSGDIWHRLGTSGNGEAGLDPSQNRQAEKGATP